MENKTCPWCGTNWEDGYWNPQCPKCLENKEQTKVHVIGIVKKYYEEKV